VKPAAHKAAEFEAFMRGARMAYEDCAKFALHIAMHSDGFANFSAGQVDQATARIIGESAKTICSNLAEGFLKKIAEMEAATSGAEHGIQ
jgi:hypothetical protein